MRGPWVPANCGREMSEMAVSEAGECVCVSKLGVWVCVLRAEEVVPCLWVECAHCPVCGRFGVKKCVQVCFVGGKGRRRGAVAEYLRVRGRIDGLGALAVACVQMAVGCGERRGGNFGVSD